MLKKTLSVALALVLALSLSLAAVAAPAASPGVTVTTGEGDTEYLDLDYYDIEYPTDISYDFTLDPQGLIAIGENEKVEFDDLDGGKIIGKDVSPIVNNSPFSVKVRAVVKATTTTGSGAAANFVSDLADVETGTTNNIALLVAPSTVDLGDSAAEFSPTTNGFAVTEAGTTLEFAFPKAVYEITDTNGTKTADVKADSGHGTALKVCGYVNTNAVWKDFTTDATGGTPTEVGIQVVWTPAKDTATYTTDDYSTTEAYGLLVAADALPQMAAGLEPAEPELTTGFVSGTRLVDTIDVGTKTSGVFFDIPFEFNGKTISSITMNGVAAVLNTNYTVTYTAGSSKISLKSGAAGDKIVVIKLSGGDTTEYKVTFKI